MHCNTISNFFDKFLNEVVSKFRPCLVKLKPFVASFPGPNPAPDPQGTGHYQAHQSVYTGRPPIQSKKQYMYMSMCQEVCHNTFFLLQKGSLTHLPITSYLAHKVDRTFLPLTHPLEKAPVRGAEQQSITLLILSPPQLQNTEGGVSSLSIKVKYV